LAERKTRKQEIVPGVMTWQLLERILKNYHLWYDVYQKTGKSSIYINGMLIDYFELLSGIDKLPPRQREALSLTCLENQKEADAARIMGFDKWSSQVGMYKRKALKTLCDNYWNQRTDDE
jgi:hypothetical protein